MIKLISVYPLRNLLKQVFKVKLNGQPDYIWFDHDSCRFVKIISSPEVYTFEGPGNGFQDSFIFSDIEVLEK